MRRDGERLSDIIEAAEKIRARLAGGRERFDADEDLQIVLVHLVQIIGEAASHLSDHVTSGQPQVPWRQIIAMRNRSYTATSRWIWTSCGTSSQLTFRSSRTR